MGDTTGFSFARTGLQDDILAQLLAKGGDLNLEISAGNIPGTTHINKFGKGEDIDIADGFVDIWDGSGNANADKVYTFSTSADIDSLSSSDNGDGQLIEVEGLDTSFDQVTQRITLSGQARVALNTALVRVHRLKSTSPTDVAGNVYCYVNGAITAGVPDVSDTIRAIINNGFNQTLMAIYTVPNGKTGFMTNFWAAIAIKTAVASIIHLDARMDGEGFQLKSATGTNSTGSSHFQHMYSPYLMFEEKTDIKISADSSANNSAVAAGFDIILVDNG